MKLLNRIRTSRNKHIGDPDGTMAVLQIAKRLVTDREESNLYAALDEALDMAAPKDAARAWWSAHRVIRRSLPDRFDNILDFSCDSTVTVEEILEVLEAAILAQGTANIRQAKGKRQ